MKRQAVRCPKCGGQLYLEQDLTARFRLPPEWACLQCGWRRAFSPRQFERTFDLDLAGEAQPSGAIAARTSAA